MSSNIVPEIVVLNAYTIGPGVLQAVTLMSFFNQLLNLAILGAKQCSTSQWQTGLFEPFAR